MSYQKLKTNINGGFPLVLDDIRWLQGQMERWQFEVFERLCPPGGALWIFGGGYPMTTAGIFGGVVYISGQGMFNVQNQLIVGWSGTLAYLRIEPSTFSPAGLKTFQDGTVNDTYELPQATIQSGTPGVGDIPLDNWAYLYQEFDEEIVTFESGISVFGGFFTIIADKKRITIRCAISGPAGTRTSDETLFTLNNTLFDPSQGGATAWGQGNGSGFVPVTISNNGEVVARFGAFNEEYPIGFELTYTL